LFHSYLLESYTNITIDLKIFLKMLNCDLNCEKILKTK
jgi:hypothetical protein